MQNDGPAFHKEVRRAFAHLYDFSYLGACPLAGSSLAGVFPSVKERGVAMHRLLREAVEHLKPPRAISEGDAQWRPYHVLYYRYVEGLKRQQILDKLAISEASFVRAQRTAITAVCDFLKGLHPPPLSPRQIPRVEHFVGRETTLAAYHEQLEKEGFALIAGPPGAGKTALGAELAGRWQTEGRPVSWITLYDGRNTTLEALLEDIGLVLAAQGQAAFWQFLQAERHKGLSSSSGSWVYYLLTLLEQGNYLLCLDDYHLADDSPAINALCADLLRSAQQVKPGLSSVPNSSRGGTERLRLLVMSRATPRFARGRHFEPLGGMSREDARRLLAASGLPGLPDEVFVELYARTGGLPVFLKLFAAWAHSQGLEDVGREEVRERLAAFARNMVKEQNVRNYLLHQVYETLSPQERRFLTCVAAFRLPFETEDAPIIELLRAEGVKDIEATWIALVERHIFTPLEGEDAISLHPLVRTYFAQRLRLNPDERARIHRRAGEYYEKDLGDVLEAGYHYFQAGGVYAERAARILSENVSRLINAGQAELALEQLERLTLHLASARSASVATTGYGVEAALRFEVAAAREALCHLLGLWEKQQASLSTLRALAEDLDDGGPQAAKRLAMVYNRQARLHEAKGESTAALTVAEAGQALARRAGDKAAEATSLRCQGVALRLRGDYAAARRCNEQALVLAREIGDQRREADNLNNLGNICYQQGDYVAARAFYQQTLTLRRMVDDRQGEAISLNNLGIAYCVMGDWAAGCEYHEQALAIRQAIGDRPGEADSLNNLGLTWCTLGDYAAAREYLEQALAIKRAIGSPQGEASSLENLGKVCHRQGNNTAARAYYEQALTAWRAVDGWRGVGQAMSGLGRVLESLGNLEEAEAAYREALTVCRELGKVAPAIEDVAGLARVALAEEREEARGYVEECLAHLAAHGVVGIEHPFEVYLTCARVLEACGERERARGVLAEAYALLMQRANKIGEELLRCSFLENVPAHRDVVREWKRASV